MTAKRIILVRHGALESQYDGCYIGSSDVALSSEGRLEAEALGSHVKACGIERIYSSPLLRARQTADQIASALPEVPVAYEALLREIDFGTWEGLTFEQISARDPEGSRRWACPNGDFAFPGGESLDAFYSRVVRIKQMLLESAHETILLVTHGGVARSLICNILDIPSQKSLSLKIDRGSVSTLSLFDNGLGTLNSLNYKPQR